MKRKQKCGNDKRIENKKKALSAAASAPGQQSLLGMFGTQKAGNSVAKLNFMEETVLAQPADELVQFSAGKQNEMVDDRDQLKKLSTKDDIAWYTGKKLSVSWLLLLESCLEVKTEMKDKKRRQLMTCSLCKEYENKVT